MSDRTVLILLGDTVFLSCITLRVKCTGVSLWVFIRLFSAGFKEKKSFDASNLDVYLAVSFLFLRSARDGGRNLAEGVAARTAMLAA